MVAESFMPGASVSKVAQGIVTLASFTCQSPNARLRHMQGKQGVGEFGSGSVRLQNPLVLADVTMSGCPVP